jgi:ribosome-associated protein
MKSSVVNEKDRVAAAKRFAIEAARFAANTRCHSVVVLEVGNLLPVCDYFVIATGTSSRQMRSVADDLIEMAEAQKFSPKNQSGIESSSWILVDCFDVIVHLFNDESRRYYDLDNLWGDARKIEWESDQPQMDTDKHR